MGRLVYLSGWFLALPDSAMMVSLRRARDALQNERSDSATEEKWFGR
jgi:hypothetical protein